MEKRICTHCSKPLKLIGCERANGKEAFIDSNWKNRKLHKKCYKEIFKSNPFSRSLKLPSNLKCNEDGRLNQSDQYILDEYFKNLNKYFDDWVRKETELM